jgi:PEGA domain/Sulfatase-modifying factor enzyme 1
MTTELFGPFEAGREIASANGATVYRAKQAGDLKREYVIKLFSPADAAITDAGEAKAELAPLFQDLISAFISRINLQKQAAESAPWFAPILASGQDRRGAWYATHFYARSVQGMLDRLVALETRDLFPLIQSVVKAALHLKKTAGRSHGNLKPSNIFIDGAGKPRSSRVLVSDPLAGEARDAAVFELADLRAVGELLYQLALRRKVDFSTGWVILPVEATRDWTALFGKQTSNWIDLCNKLLDPNLSLAHYNLEKLDADLASLKPKLPLAVTLVPAAVVVLLAAGLAAWFFVRTRNYGTLEVTIVPPGSRLVIIPTDAAGFEDWQRAQTNAAPVKISLKKGTYEIEAEHPSIYGNLVSARRLPITIKPGKTVRTALSLSYGGLVVSSEPPGAKFEINGRPAQTPFTNLYLPPGQLTFQLWRDGYETTNLSVIVAANHALAEVAARLKQPAPGSVLVEFTSDPPGANILLDGHSLGEAPLRMSVVEGRHEITAELPSFTTERRALVVRRGATLSQAFYFPHGTLSVENSDPSAVEIFVNHRLVGTSPTNVFLPVGRFDLAFRANGYTTNSATISVADKGRLQFSPTLKAIAGFVQLASDVPGTEIRDQADALLATNISDVPTELALRPGSYTLHATHGDLDPFEIGRVDVKPGLTNIAPPIRFTFGTVMFTNVEPVNAAIRRVGQTPVQAGTSVFQRPGSPVVYLAEAPGYQTYSNAVVVAAGETRQLGINLPKQTVAVNLASDPPGAEFFDNGAKLSGSGPEYGLPWGASRLVGFFPRLGAITNNVEIKLSGPNTVPEFKFTYGTIVLTNLPGDVVVKENDEPLLATAGPLRRVYDQPGRHVYDLYEQGEKVDTVVTNFPAGAVITLHSAIAAREYVDGIGLRLEKVRNLFGPGKDGWVGKSEVTEAQYEKVMGTNPSKYEGADLPVENVSWLQAEEFCRKLTQMDQQTPPGPPGQYELPTLEQWKKFSSGANLKWAVTGQNLPARVGSKGPDALGLNDVYGNVFEWLGGGGPQNKNFIGGGFRSRLGFGGMQTFVAPQQLQLDQTYDDLGFRVIWVPNSAAAR